MELDDFFIRYKLLKELGSYIEGTKKDDQKTIELAKNLIKYFPDFKYDGPAYRSILGEWSNGFLNASWSLHETATWYAFDSQFPKNKRPLMKTYSARVSGFNIGEFVESVKELDIFSSYVVTMACEEHEILATEHDEDSIVEIPHERSA